MYDVAGTTLQNATNGVINLFYFDPVMNVMTTEDYRNIYWPKLEKAIDQLLLQSPVDYIPISYEQIYRYSNSRRRSSEQEAFLPEIKLLCHLVSDEWANTLLTFLLTCLK